MVNPRALTAAAGVAAALVFVSLSLMGTRSPPSMLLRAPRVGVRSSFRPMAVSSGVRSMACEAQNAARRSFMLGGVGTVGTLIAIQGDVRAEAPFSGVVPVDLLTPGQKDQQRIALYNLMKEKIGEKVSSPASLITQLVLLDAVDRNTDEKTGGLNGGVQYQLDTFGADASLKKTAEEIKAAQSEINTIWKSEDKLSFADVMVFAGYLKTKQAFNKALSDRATTNGGGATIASGFGNPFPIPALGRQEADKSQVSSPSVKANIPDLVSALKSMGFGARDIAALGVCFPGSSDLPAVEAELSATDPKIAGFIKAAQQSRKTVTQNSYQVNVADAYNKLVTFKQGKLNPLAYYYPAPKFDISKVKL